MNKWEMEVKGKDIPYTTTVDKEKGVFTIVAMVGEVPASNITISCEQKQTTVSLEDDGDRSSAVVYHPKLLKHINLSEVKKKVEEGKVEISIPFLVPEKAQKKKKKARSTLGLTQGGAKVPQSREVELEMALSVVNRVADKQEAEIKQKRRADHEKATAQRKKQMERKQRKEQNEKNRKRQLAELRSQQ